VLDALVYREDGEVPGSGQPAVVEQLGKAPQHRDGAVRAGVDPVDEVGPRQVEPVPGYGLALVLQKILAVLQNGIEGLAHRSVGGGS